MHHDEAPDIMKGAFMDKRKYGKYDSVAYIDPVSKNVDVINIEDLIEERNKDKGAFLTKYSNNMYCPECKVPQLTLCQTKYGFYLRGFQHQVHNDDCGFGLDEISDNHIETKIDLEPNKRDIQLRLNQVIDSLLKKVRTKDHPLAVNINGNVIDMKPIPREKVSRKSNQKRIPSKSLTSPFHEEDYYRFMVFYGRVKIKWEKRLSKDGPFMSLNIYKIGAENPFCSGTMNEQVYSQIKNNVDCDVALIAIFTSMKWTKKNNKKYNNFKIKKSHMIIIEKE